MKKRLFHGLLFLIALIGWGGHEVIAQNQIDVTLKYNTTTSLYEVYGRPNFTDPAFGVGAGTQISIVLPASVADNALTITSVNGGAWSDASRLYAPTADPTNDFHGIATAGNYTSLVSGQEILFFTFGVTGACLPGVRLFENVTDPSSSAAGFSGSDYKNYIGDALNFGDDVYRSNYTTPGGLCGIPPTIGFVSPVNGSQTTTNPPVSGTATPGASVTVGEGGATLCTTVASAAGAWSCPGATFTTGPHTLTAIASNTSGVSPIATTSFTIVSPPAGNPPVVVGQPLVTNVNIPGSVNLPVSDPDGTTSFTAAICGQPTNGVASVPATFTGSSLVVSYTPPANFTGNAGTVCVIITDPTGLTSVAYVPVVVNPISGTAPTGQPPVVTVVPITTPANTTATVCLPVTDPNGTTSFTAAICGQPTNGTATIVSTGTATVCLNYTPPTNFTGNAGTVCVVVTDPTGLTTTVQVPVTVIPNPTPNPGMAHPPVVVGAPLVTNQNQPGSVCLPVTDPDGTTAFTVSVCGQPTSGTASVPATVSGTSLCLNYTPANGFSGNAGTLCVVVTDPTGLSTTALVPVTVIPANVPTQRSPVVVGQPLVTNQNQPGSVCLPVSDPDGTTSFTAAICGQPANGTALVPATVTGNQLCVSYTPPTGFTGNAGTVCVIVTDPTGLTSVAYVPVVVNPVSGTAPTGQPPVVTVVPITTPINTTATVCLPVSDPNGTTSFTVAICGQPTNGTATVVSSGTATVCIKYTPPTNFTGNAGNVCVVVTDPTGLTTTVQVPVTVIPNPTPDPVVQHPPVVISAPLVTNQNQPGSVCLPVSDPDGTTAFTITVCGQPTSGIASVPATVNGNNLCITYTPVTGFSGNAGNVCLIITDPNGLTTTTQVPVTVIPASVPSSLLANPDSGTLTAGSSITIPVLANDTNPSGSNPASLTAVSLPTITTQPTKGTVVVNMDGTVTYTASGSATGQDSFIYQICSLLSPSQCDTALVRMQLNPVPQPPVIIGQPLVTNVNQPGSVCLPVSDPDGTTSFTASICNQPTNGTASVSATITGNSLCMNYTPPANFTGNAGTVCVIVTDPTGLTSVAYVPVVVNPVSGTAPTSQPPVVTVVPITTPINTTATVCLPVTDPNGTTSFTAAICGQPTNGTATIVSAGTATVCIKYTPPTNFTGNAGNVCVTVTDPTGLTTTVQVPVTVIPDPTPNPGVAHPPVVVGAPLVTNQNQPGSVCLPVSDPDGTTSFTVSVCGQPNSGTASMPATVTGNSLCIIYTPANGFSGNAGTVCVVVTDPTGLSTTALVPVTVIPASIPTQRPPVVTGAPLVTTINQPGSVCLPVFDADGTNVYTMSICGQPANGVASVPASVTGNSVCVNYTPPTNFTGNAGTVCVLVTDPTGLTSVAYVPVVVTPISSTAPTPQPPVVTGVPITTPINQTVIVCMPISSPNGAKSFTTTICGQPTSGTVSVVSSGTASVCVKYTPPTNFTGNAGNACLTITDPSGQTTVVTVPVTVVPDPTAPGNQHPPSVVPAPLVTNQNQPGSVCLPVTDPDGTTAFTVSVCGQPISGTTVVPTTVNNGVLCINYTPVSGYSGNPGNLCLIVTDPTGLTTTVLVPVTVIPTVVQHPPVIGLGSITTPINTTAQICLPLSDPDGTSSYTVAICGQPTSGTVSAPGVVVGNQVCIIYTPTANFTGNAGSFCIKVTDPTGLTTTQTVSVSVVPASTPCVTISLKVFLEGPYNASTHLMNTTLNQRGLLPGQTPIGNFAVTTPAGQPYNTAPWNYSGTESMTTYPSDIVDWVLVTLRTDSLTTQSTFRAAGLLHNDGRITFVKSCFTIPAGSYFAVIEQRNHLGVMSPRRVNVTNNVLNFDFTQQDSYSITNPPSFGEILIDGRWMMYGADGKKDIFTDNFDINFFDSKLWKDESGIFDQYRYGDFNMDADVNFSDSVLWNKNNGRYSKVPH